MTTTGLCDGDGPNLPTASLNTLRGFELETYQIPLDQLLPSKKVPDGVMSTRKYKQIVTKLLANGAVKSYIGRHEPEILPHLELLVNTVSMEEAVQQQAQTTEATPEEAATRA